MDPLKPQHAAQGPGAAQAAQNGAAAPTGTAETPLAEQPVAINFAELEQRAADAAAVAARGAMGGLVARTDQLETKLARIDRQTLMLIGMVAVLAWGVKSIAGKVALDASPAAAPTG